MRGTRTNASSNTAPRTATIAAIAREGRKAAPAAAGKIDYCAFLEGFYHGASEDDLDEDPAVLAAAALDQLEWASQRRPGRPKVRVFNPAADADGWTSRYTIVETVTDDSPFLVDSISMQISSLGHIVVSNLHPIFVAERDRNGRLTGLDSSNGQNDQNGRAESWMQIAIPRVVEDAALRELKSRLVATLDDVRLAVRDWQRMLERLAQVANELASDGHTPGKLRDEMSEFLAWLGDNHFTFLGYCEYRRDGDAPEPVESSGLGLLQSKRGLQRTAISVERRAIELGIAKAPIRSTIHRPAPLDDVSITIFDKRGRPLREHRFLGLFTSIAYTESPRNIPLLRMKTRAIMSQSGFDPRSHKGKSLLHILDTLPRDELLQASTDELQSTALGVLALEERPRARVFVRLDSRKNFYSCLVYLPRNRYSEVTRTRIESRLAELLDGRIADSQVAVGESVLARLAITIAVGDGKPATPDLAALNAAVVEAATTWPERVRARLMETCDEARALELHGRFSESFPLAYQEALSPARAVRDIALIAAVADGDAEVMTALEVDAAESELWFTVTRRDESVPLYRANPILENMGLRVIGERNFRLGVGDTTIWMQDFHLMSAMEADATEALAERFRRCFVETLHGEVENDSFNSLILHAGLDWRQANVLRAYCKYLLQTRLRFSQAYMLETLIRYPALAAALIDYFESSFDPDLVQSVRENRRDRSQRAIKAELDRAVSLDDDRILRAFTSVVQATLRTNHFQTVGGAPRRCLSFKLDPARIPDLPKPRPRFEIFVYSCRVEGVHLRCGSVARGGLRWSDRREDFRTEVLGLMKAQQVKNTVIVPAGAKGGFVCKRLPQGDRQAIQAEVVECYTMFLRGLLDITDNIVGEKTVTPDRVVARDGPDPYFVVAADKGTATFSDIANGISAEYGFWLGDAFASGGSAGYDHKKMGITARGAWESVKRHFRELGLDTQSQDFTVAGIGDMSGDVFGNGMLLSRHIRLVAAFNHLHIFIDPNPDPARSFEERRRLFELPRSSWEDYDPEAISTGGGVFRRDAKSIALSPEARAALGIEAEALSPPELIRAILKAPVDLLWNGGIGTYVKSSSESDLDAGDPVNDAVRVDGADLRCRVVGEGGNLGLTQLGRVEFAQRGGHLNTDFIDNSGGVDSSDREVNIKILLGEAVKRGTLTLPKRNALLARMTEAVAAGVLANNYAQSQALSMMVSHAKERLGEHGRLIRILESKGLLDRAIEFLPSDEQIDERRKDGGGLTRPELAIVLAYAKIELYESLVASDIPDDPHFADELIAYFPAEIGRRFGDLIPTHRLAREITAMLIASSMINRMGPFFAIRTQDDTGAGPAQVARAYAIVRSLFRTRELWQSIEALDGAVQAQVQYDCMYQASRMVRRAVYWLLHRYTNDLDISRTVAAMQPCVRQVQSAVPRALCGFARRRYETDVRDYEGLGMPAPTAHRIARLRLMTQTLDITELALGAKLDAADVAKLHFELGRGLRLDWLREQIEGLESEGHWRAMARGTLRETLGREQQALVGNVLARTGTGEPRSVLADWMAESNAQITRMKRMFDEMRASGQLDFATLSIALREVGRLS